MATEPNPAPAWQAHRFAWFKGQHDTRIDNGEDYDTQTLAALFAMKPGAKSKHAGPAMIPSSYADYNAREHAAQREHGAYIALTLDVDKGDHPLDAIQDAVEAFAGGAAWLIYSSAHSRPGDRRWRAILPLDTPQPFAVWHDAQTALHDYLAAHGITPDRALARAAQPVYLPNVPHRHASSGTALRGDDGEPLYYQQRTSSLTAPGLSIEAPALAAGIAAIHRKRQDDEAARQAIRREAEKRRAAMPRGDGASLIDDFNASTSVVTMLEASGYQQCPRSPEDWRSPQQTGDTHATRVIGSKWVSLSESDAASGLGDKCAAGCYGDAYDLYVHYTHKGQHKDAFRALGAERRAAQGNVIPFPALDPQEWMSDVPAYETLPEWAAMEPDEPHSEMCGAESAESAGLPLFHPADWQGLTPPQREWRWDAFVPNYQATLLTGAGAAGKSLATQQMATCIAMGLPFLGVETRQTPALYVTCEDDLGELHRRQEAICAALNITLEQTRGKLFLLSLQGEIGNELATFDHDGRMAVAERFIQIEAACHEHGIGHVTLDNTAHTFSGNENDRHQVAAFVNLNNRLAQNINGSVIMVGHPNKAGDSYSGSTAWENQVRSRLYLEVPKGEEGAPLDPDMRVLRNEKANYSQRGAEVRFYWFKGAFVLEEQIPKSAVGDVRETAHAAYVNELFLRLLDRLTEQKRAVSHAPNLSNYAPRVMAAMPEARGTMRADFAGAMERLFTLNRIIASAPLWKGKDRHPVLGLARQ